MLASERVWEIPQPNKALAEQIANSLGCLPLIGQALLNRGMTTPAEATAFCNASLDKLHDPFLLEDMGVAVQRLRDAISRREKILIFGDYDVDGISGTALLVRELNLLGCSPYYYIPNRLVEGYGLNKERIARAHQEGISLIVTVDNGVSSHEEVRYAAGLGIDVVVCDHHEPDGQLPPAVAVLNPKRENSAYPFRDLSGVAVALKLLTALSGKIPQNLDFAALGTIADIVPLVDENRILARTGLEMINRNGTSTPGIWELSRVSGLEGKQINSGNVAFQLAPRLNAAGRLGSGQLGVQLLLTSSQALAQRIARKLDEENRNRQAIESEILIQALEKIEREFDAARDFSIFLCDNRWHPGVIGIVASKIVELYHRPAVLVAMGEQVGKGSARSIRNLHMCEALRQCQEHLVGFGGHRFAAGLTVEAAKFECCRQAFEQACRAKLLEEDLRAMVRADAIVALEDISGTLIEQLERLAPFGNANPTPAFVSLGVSVAGSVQLLREKHLKFSVRQGKKVLPVIGFKMEQYERLVNEAPLLDIVYTPQFNSYRGNTTIQLSLRDIRPHQEM